MSAKALYTRLVGKLYAHWGALHKMEDWRDPESAVDQITEELVSARATLASAQNSSWVWNRKIIEAIRAVVPDAPVLDEDLIKAVRALATDAERLDWLESEIEREATCATDEMSLFRRNQPITRSAIDAAVKAAGE